MGLGTIGQDTARKFALLGFPTAGWSRTARTLADIETFHGADGFTKFLARTDILIDVLPLTRETRGILGAKAFAALPKGAFFINMARGGHATNPRTASPGVIENIKRLRAGQPLIHTVDPKTGY
jgi:glyoxylate/hydroxypyruvate reductase A